MGADLVPGEMLAQPGTAAALCHGHNASSHGTSPGVSLGDRAQVGEALALDLGSRGGPLRLDSVTPCCLGCCSGAGGLLALCVPLLLCPESSVGAEWPLMGLLCIKFCDLYLWLCFCDCNQGGVQ